MALISWDDFTKVALRVGTVLEARDFPEAKKPAWLLRVDFGPEIGVLQSSAQLTALYRKEDLVGRQVLAVVNLPPKQVGPHRSQCLITGFVDSQGNIVLARPDRPVPNGAALC